VLSAFEATRGEAIPRTKKLHYKDEEVDFFFNFLLGDTSTLKVKPKEL